MLNARIFRSLEHLNEVTAWWLGNVADVRQRRKLGKTPLEAWQEEQPHLLVLPAIGYDTARVVYRTKVSSPTHDEQENNDSPSGQADEEEKNTDEEDDTSGAA